MNGLFASLPLLLTAVPAPLLASHAGTIGSSGPTQEVLVAEDVSSAIAGIREQAGAPGLVAVAIQDGSVVAWGVDGVRAQGSEEKLELEDPMHLGSCGKAMTSTLVARLVEEGRLSFDTTIAEALPDLAKKIDAGFHGVTVDMLLRHQGGIAERRRPELENLDLRRAESQGTPSQIRLEVLAQVMSHAPLLPDKGSFDYSNFGYMTVGAMAEAATGKSWEELMVEKVFRPLNMSSAGTGSPTGPSAPVGHRQVGKALEALPPGPEGILPACMGPAGLVHSSLTDWGKFVADHMRGERGEDGLLKAATYQHLHADPHDSSYAAGWGVSQHVVSWTEPMLSLSHNGSDNTWYSKVMALPEWDLAVLSATNCAGTAGTRAVEQAENLLLETLGFAE